MIHESVKMYGDTRIGKNPILLENVVIGYPTTDILKQKGIMPHAPEPCPIVTIGDNALIRSNTIIYCEVEIGNKFMSGHNVLIRERTKIGDNVLVGTNTVIEGYTTIGSNVNIQSNVYIPMHTFIEDFVFIGPNAVMTNDKYPLRVDYELKGPVIRKGATIGANATILPGIEIGEGAFVAAGSVVTKDIPPWKLALGTPAKMKEMPECLKVLNTLFLFTKHFLLEKEPVLRK